MGNVRCKVREGEAKRWSRHGLLVLEQHTTENAYILHVAMLDTGKKKMYDRQSTVKLHLSLALACTHTHTELHMLVQKWINKFMWDHKAQLPQFLYASQCAHLQLALHHASLSLCILDPQQALTNPRSWKSISHENWPGVLCQTLLLLHSSTFLFFM
jgi:hypothetical protein